MYHKTQDAKLIQTKDEYATLGKDWQDTPAEFDKKSDAKTPEQAPVCDKGGDTGSGDGGESKPITEENFIKMTIKELKEYLISRGVSEDVVKKLKQKDQLIARIGELGK